MALIALILSTAGIPVTAQASESPEIADAERADVRSTQARLPYDTSENEAQEYTSRAMWVWNKGRRAYLLTRGNAAKGFQKIVSMDLDSGAILSREVLVERGYSTPYVPVNSKHLGQDRSMAVDEEGGRVFVATQLGLSSTNPPVQVVPRMASRLQPCAQASSLGCLTGVSVLDAATLEHVRHVALQPLVLDGTPMAVPQLLAMTYTPSLGELPGKLHLLVQDNMLGGIENLPRGSMPKQAQPTRTFLVQLDPESGRQDWAVPLTGCAGVRVGRDQAEWAATNFLPQEAALFRGRSPDDAAIYVACHTRTQSFTGGVVRVPLDQNGAPETMPLTVQGGPDEEPAPPQGPEASMFSPPTVRGAGPTEVQGPDNVYKFLADPDSGRLLMQVLDGTPLAEVWWVFDTSLMRFVGTVGIGAPVETDNTYAALDWVSGRLYVFATKHAKGGLSFPGGLFVADIRSTPVAQALHYPHLAALTPVGTTPGDTDVSRPLTVERLPGGGARIWLPDKFDGDTEPTGYRAIEDHRATAPADPEDDFAGRTLDLEEVEGVTQSTFDGAARGYGVRALLIGGAEAAARFDQLDPVGVVEQCGDPNWSDTDSTVGTFTFLPEGRRQGGPCYWTDVPVSVPCLDGNREIVVASVGPDGPAVIDGTGSRGTAQPIIVDPVTTMDAEHVASRCAGQDWEQLWTTALFGRPPTDEPGSKLPEGLMARCVSGENEGDETGDEVLRGYAASVACGEQEASGHAYARGMAIEAVTVSEALSNFRIYRDPGRGIVSRVESVVRGLALHGGVRIDMVRGVAESWANGRKQPVSAAERPADYSPNCDFERSAGTCFRRHLFGVSTPGWSCGPCGDEQAFIEAMNAAFRSQAVVRLREPDPVLAQGAQNGFLAAIQKPEPDRFGDLILNADLLQTVLPTLEVVRYASPNRFLSRAGARGRQIYQFAGVEVSSSYGIQCLLVYDEASNTCAAPSEPPGSITVSLADGDGKPLAGGAFEVRSDVDADGVLGLKDTLLPNGACVTADDGVGTCRFDNLAPGPYVVSQVAAPPGYGKSAEPFVVELASGEARTVAFTNVSNLSSVELKATDEAGGPLAGAIFAAYPDPDADGKVAPEAKPAAECTTDAQGACRMQVPAGSYVLVQTSAPGGLEGIEPVPFTFASGGQVAAVTVVNYRPEAPQAPQAPQGPVSPVYTPPVDVAPPTEVIHDYVPPAGTEPLPETAPGPSLPDQIGGTAVQVVRAPGDALRLLSRDPKQAVAWTAAIALFGLAVLAVRRRHQALELLSTP